MSSADSPPTLGPSGSRHLSDEAFVSAFEGLTLPDEAFRHFDHLRLAWIFLREAGPGGLDHACGRIRAAIRRFAAHHGAPAMYHETITVSYMRLMAAHLALSPELDRFDDFAAAHPALFDPQLPLSYYSEERLRSEEARSGWVEPDLRALP
jgi:hypothetical protein